jgi:hypothetical protein
MTAAPFWILQYDADGAVRVCAVHHDEDAPLPAEGVASIYTPLERIRDHMSEQIVEQPSRASERRAWLAKQALSLPTEDLIEMGKLAGFEEMSGEHVRSARHAQGIKIGKRRGKKALALTPGSEEWKNERGRKGGHARWATKKEQDPTKKKKKRRTLVLRPISEATAFVGSKPFDLPVADVVALAKKAGITITNQQVYKARRVMLKRSDSPLAEPSTTRPPQVARVTKANGVEHRAGARPFESVVPTLDDAEIRRFITMAGTVRIRAILQAVEEGR